MNLMKLVPSTALEFQYEQWMERLGRTTMLKHHLERCQDLAEKISASEMTNAEKVRRLRYLSAVVSKLQTHLADTLACWPSTRN